ncbi:UDP-N-acetylglucosamine 2-epimerase (non-hydrolyzing) [bacterium]|nr:UDP-N-acetylglucosamine 2-epimerase (non-hydrolyzing) [bacterium]
MFKLPRITFVLGTRPEAIKLAPVILTFLKYKGFETRIVFSGQHKEMVFQVLDLFDIKIDLNLNVMKRGQSLSSLTSKILERLTKDLIKNQSQLVIIQGDTTTALAASMAAFYQKIPVAHVEAGLRTGNILNPFPEEVNRRMISQLASLHFAPTKDSFKYLKKIGVEGKVFMTGNTVIDALQMIVSTQRNKLNSRDIFKQKGKKMILLTIHRRENWGKRIEDIAVAIKETLISNPNLFVLLPVHKNPIVKNSIEKILGLNPQVKIIEPLKYSDMVIAMSECDLILTDSGGIQEEAPTFKKPVLVLRETTERPEAINAGTAKLIGTDPENIKTETNKLLNNLDAYNAMIAAENPFGDGKSSQMILEKCINYLNTY